MSAKTEMKEQSIETKKIEEKEARLRMLQEITNEKVGKVLKKTINELLDIIDETLQEKIKILGFPKEEIVKKEKEKIYSEVLFGFMIYYLMTIKELTKLLKNEPEN